MSVTTTKGPEVSRTRTALISAAAVAAPLLTTPAANPATVTVVTGPPGVDIGPATGWIGADLGDGLAVRTVVSGRGSADSPAREGAHCHSAPVPDPVPRNATGAPEPYAPLRVLPSASLVAPDANLGVAFTGVPTRDIGFDLATAADVIGDVGHRLTVQFPGWAGPGRAAIPAGVEVGDLATAARDSVLRAAAGSSRQVLIEAGDGQTFLDALHTVGIPPWSPHIDRLQLRLVLNAASHADDHRPAVSLAATASREIIRQGCGYLGTRGNSDRLAGFAVILEGFHVLVPEIAGMRTTTLAAGPETPDGVPESVTDRIGELLAGFERRTGASVCAIGTGIDPATRRCQYIDVSM